jgi:hypothetical protein
VPNLVHELKGRRLKKKDNVSWLMAQTRIYDYSLPGIISICATYHHHIPNNGITHTTIFPAQTSTQSKSVIRITNNANVSDAAAQILGKKRVVDVGLDPRWRGVMPIPSGSGKKGAHGC